MPGRNSSIEILLIEDSPNDADLMADALRKSALEPQLTVIEDGEEAMQYLRRQGAYAVAPRPDLILLDLKLPRKNGHEVLQELKQDADLRRIPVVVLTSFDSEQAIRGAYDRQANCCVCKPGDDEEFAQVIKRIEQFWFDRVRRAPRP